MKLANGNGKRPIQDISFVGDDLYHCWWDGENTTFYKNNSSIDALIGKHQGFSYPFVLSRPGKIYDLTGGPSNDLTLARQPTKGTYVTGCLHNGLEPILVSSDGYEMITGVKLYGTPSGLYLQGVEFKDGIIHTLWGNSSMFTHKWVILSHTQDGNLVRRMKAPWRPKGGWFAKRYEPEGLSFNKRGELYFGYCEKGWFSGYKCFARKVSEVFK